MDIRQLRYFVAVAEERSFSRAALRLNVSQPPLSVQIKALEQDLGATLLDRDRRSVALTSVGAIFLDHARRILREFDLGRSAVRLAAGGAIGLVRIGYTSSVPMVAAFSTLIGNFRTSWPDVKLEMRHMATGDQLKAIAAGDLDVGFLRPANSFRPKADLSVIPLWRDELMVFFADTDPLVAFEGKIELETIATRNIVTISADVGCGVYEQTALLWRDAGVVPRIVQEARELRTVLGLVATGIGIAILPSYFRQAGVTNVAARSLAHDATASSLMLAHRAGTQPASIENFIAHFIGSAEKATRRIADDR